MYMALDCFLKENYLFLFSLKNYTRCLEKKTLLLCTKISAYAMV